MTNANTTPQEINRNSPPISSSSSMVLPHQGSNHLSPFGVNLTQTSCIKLDKNNFLLWQNMVLPIIRGHNLEGYSGNKEIAMRVMGSNNSNQLWTAVKESYGIKNKSRIIFLTGELQKARKGDVRFKSYKWTD
ncbi:Uncharacterized protein Adt_28681 [Abeliophyllum distichum]|uniref:Retrotransposon Copia-like N-terminal domain-containing protein n=1 Tax=Abeliophyllum distichum TaxID=126358 RepID=A0ABD1RX85_9LAMI